MYGYNKKDSGSDSSPNTMIYAKRERLSEYNMAKPSLSLYGLAKHRLTTIDELVLTAPAVARHSPKSGSNG